MKNFSKLGIPRKNNIFRLLNSTRGPSPRAMKMKVF